MDSATCGRLTRLLRCHKVNKKKNRTKYQHQTLRFTSFNRHSRCFLFFFFFSRRFLLQNGADPNILSLDNHRPIDLVDKEDHSLRQLIAEFTLDSAVGGAATSSSSSYQQRKSSKASFHQLDDVDKLFGQKLSLKA